MAKAPSDKKLIAALSAAVLPLGGRVGSVDGDSVVIAFDDLEVSVFLDNLRRRVAAGEALAHAALAFARAIAPGFASAPTTRAALIPGLRTMLEQPAVASADVLRRPLSPELVVCLVWSPPDEAHVVFLSDSSLRDCDVSPEAAWRFAAANMDSLLAATPLEIGDDAPLLGMLSTPSLFKASLLTAPSLRALVEPRLGWPVRAVAPCRDFVFLFRADDAELVPRLAATVMRELEASAYPLTPEVLEVSDAGLRALGSFRPREAAAPPAREDGPLAMILKLLAVEALAPTADGADAPMPAAIAQLRGVLSPDTRFDRESLAVLLEMTAETGAERLPYLRAVVDALAPLSAESRGVAAYLTGILAYNSHRYETAERYLRMAATAFPYSIGAGLAHAKCLVSEPLVDYKVPLDDDGEPTREPKKRALTKVEQRAADDAVEAMTARLDRVGAMPPEEELLAFLHETSFGETVGEADVLLWSIGAAVDRGDTTKTLAHCERLCALRPTFAKAWGQRALELTKQQRHEEAIAAYAETVRVFTQLGPAGAAEWPGPDPRGQLLFNRACELAFVGRKAESLTDLKAAIGYEKTWAQEAKADDYFKALWKDKDFKAVVKGA